MPNYLQLPVCLASGCQDRLVICHSVSVDGNEADFEAEKSALISHLLHRTARRSVIARRMQKAAKTALAQEVPRQQAEELAAAKHRQEQALKVEEALFVPHVEQIAKVNAEVTRPTCMRLRLRR